MYQKISQFTRATPIHSLLSAINEFSWFHHHGRHVIEVIEIRRIPENGEEEKIAHRVLKKPPDADVDACASCVEP